MRCEVGASSGCAGATNGNITCCWDVSIHVRMLDMPELIRNTLRDGLRKLNLSRHASSFVDRGCCANVPIMAYFLLSQELLCSCVRAALLDNEFLEGRFLRHSFPHELAIVGHPASSGCMLNFEQTVAPGTASCSNARWQQCHLDCPDYSRQTTARLTDPGSPPGPQINKYHV